MEKMQEIYELDAKMNPLKGLPYGLQHVLAMFVANITPIMIIAGACGVGQNDVARLIQSAMLIAGIGTFIQLFPLWRIGSRLPIVMGISFTFVGRMNSSSESEYLPLFLHEKNHKCTIKPESRLTNVHPTENLNRGSQMFALHIYLLLRSA